MVGVALVHRLCRPPRLARFRWQELGVMVAWVVAPVIFYLVALPINRKCGPIGN